MSTPQTTFDPQQPHLISEGNMQFTLGTFDGKSIEYDFDSVLRYLDTKGKLVFGKNFKIYDEDRALLLKLSSYFVGDREACQKYGLDIDKGLMLSGPVGCGKTTLMRLLPHIVPHKRDYDIIPCRNIVFGFNNIGFKMIQDYADRRSYCFDDLGVEPTGRHYGQDCNVMGEILISRYEMSRNFPPLRGLRGAGNSHKNSRLSHRAQSRCHITTNLNADELESRYGERVRSRLREMVNVVAFDANSKDKRQ